MVYSFKLAKAASNPSYILIFFAPTPVLFDSSRLFFLRICSISGSILPSYRGTILIYSSVQLSFKWFRIPNGGQYCWDVNYIEGLLQNWISIHMKITINSDLSGCVNTSVSSPIVQHCDFLLWTRFFCSEVSMTKTNYHHKILVAYFELIDINSIVTIESSPHHFGPLKLDGPGIWCKSYALICRIKIQ